MGRRLTIVQPIYIRTDRPFTFFYCTHFCERKLVVFDTLALSKKKEDDSDRTMDENLPNLFDQFDNFSFWRFIAADLLERVESA
uniref:Uncharacterized protein n=1 Tax=Romanomermis culicivorax TaxID=13658 RepID=A0A915L747_ROMCU